MAWEKERTTLPFMYVYRRPTVRPSVSHLVTLSVFPARPHSRYNWPQHCCLLRFSHFFGSSRKTREKLAVIWCYFNLFAFRSDSLFWPIAHEQPQAATESTTRNPLPVHWTPLGAGVGFLSSASAIDNLNYLDRRAPKPFSAHHKLLKSKRLSIRP